MEAREFVKNGQVKLPPGFRFHPTDEELVVQYLKRKAFSCPLPASIIPEIDLGKLNPWDSPRCFGGENYLFFLRERKGDGTKGRVCRLETRLGYWKPSGKETSVLASSRGKELVGAKQAMVFYRGKGHHGSKTEWIMHVYSLPNDEFFKSSAQGSLASNKEWVVCRIVEKRLSIKLKARSTRHEELYHQFPASCSSSSSSCLTDDLSDDESTNGEEAISKMFIA